MFLAIIAEMLRGMMLDVPWPTQECPWYHPEREFPTWKYGTSRHVALGTFQFGEVFQFPEYIYIYIRIYICVHTIIWYIIFCALQLLKNFQDDAAKCWELKHVDSNICRPFYFSLQVAKRRFNVTQVSYQCLLMPFGCYLLTDVMWIFGLLQQRLKRELISWFSSRKRQEASNILNQIRWMLCLIQTRKREVDDNWRMHVSVILW